MSRLTSLFRRPCAEARHSSRPRTALRRIFGFCGDDRGQLSIEAALMLPLLTWVYVAGFAFFDSYRADSTNVKAAYAVGDLFSRETRDVDAGYIDGMNGVFRYMTVSEQQTWIRVSSIGWDKNANDFKIIWSHATGGHDPAELEALRARLPMMAEEDSVIVVETYMPYRPKFNVGIQPFTFRNVVVTRPRFTPKLCWAGQSCAV